MWKSKILGETCTRVIEMHHLYNSEAIHPIRHLTDMLGFHAQIVGSPFHSQILQLD